MNPNLRLGIKQARPKGIIHRNCRWIHFIVCNTGMITLQCPDTMILYSPWGWAVHRAPRLWAWTPWGLAHNEVNIGKPNHKQTNAIVCIRPPETLARAKYDPEEPFEMILGWMPSEIAFFTDCINELNQRQSIVCRNILGSGRIMYVSKSSCVIGGLWSNVLTWSTLMLSARTALVKI